MQVPEISPAEQGTLETARQPTVNCIALELETILGSRVFARAERSVRFLRFVTEMTLAGKAGELKETVIGVSVFGRKPDYDPRIDPIVRMEAAKLRTRLESYYSKEGSVDPVVIQLPKGGYGPVFRSKDEVIPIPAGTYGLQLTVEDSTGHAAKVIETVTHPADGLPDAGPTQPLTPAVSGVNPASPTATVGNQNVQVFGANFQDGLTVDVFDAGGELVTNQSGMQILNVTVSSFTVVVNFDGNAGSYGIEVINPANQRSSRFSFTVQAQRLTPAVSGINPSSPTATDRNKRRQNFSNT